MKKTYLGVLLVVLSAAGYGFLPIFASYAYRNHISVQTLLFLRFSMAFALFLAYMLIRRVPWNMTLRGLLPLVFLGGVCYTLHSTFYFTSLLYISASMAVLLFYTYPMVVAVFSFIIHREKPGPGVIAALVLSFGGLLLILLSGEGTGPVGMAGILLALAAALVYSSYVLVGNRVVRKNSPIVTSTLITLFTAMGILATGLVKGSIRFDFGTGAWIPTVCLALVCTVLPIFTFFKGLEILGSTRTSMLSMMEPVFTVLYSALLLNSLLTPLQMLGGVAVLAGAFLITASKAS